MSKRINCKIIVCCHKRDIYANQYPYLPIQVGKAVSNLDLGIQGDDEGDNISMKNGSYCELTGMYWAWKNLKDVDVIGLCHYRRYFDFHQQCRNGFPHTSFPLSSFSKLDLSVPESVIDKVCQGAIYAASPEINRYSLEIRYCVDHYSDDFRRLRRVVNETQSKEVKEAFFKYMCQSNKFHHYNMFLMRWDDFDSLCSWLFPLLEHFEDRTDITNYSTNQKRIYGYVSEFIFNLWLGLHKSNVIETPVLWLNEYYDQLSCYSRMKYMFRKLLNNVSFELAKPRYPQE